MLGARGRLAGWMEGPGGPQGEVGRTVATPKAFTGGSGKTDQITMDALGFDNVDPEANERFFRETFQAEIDAATVIPVLEGGDAEVQLVDVRDPDSYEAGHVEGAINIPFEDLGKRAGELDPDTGVLVYCYDAPCMLSARAARLLSSKGMRVKDVIGGFEDFEKKGATIAEGRGPETAKTVAAAT